MSEESIRLRQLLLQRAGYSISNTGVVDEHYHKIVRIFQGNVNHEITGELSDGEITLLKRMTKTP